MEASMRVDRLLVPSFISAIVLWCGLILVVRSAAETLPSADSIANREEKILLRASANEPLFLDPFRRSSTTLPIKKVLDDAEVDFDGTLRRSFGPQFNSLIPIKISRKFELPPEIYLCTEPLVHYFHGEAYLSNLISAIELNEQNGEIRLSLREGVRFYQKSPNQGEVVSRLATIEDLKFSFLLRLRAHKEIGQSYHLGVFEKVEVVDERTLVLRLGEGVLPKDAVLTLVNLHVGLFSSEQYSDLLDATTPQNDRSPLRWQAPWCSGRYVVDRFDQGGKEISYMRVDDHWSYKSGAIKPSFKIVSYTYRADRSAEVALFLADKVDWVASPEKDRLDTGVGTAARSAKVSQLSSASQLANVFYLRPNIESVPEPVRLAVFEIVQNFERLKPMTTSLMGPLSSFFPHLGFESIEKQYLTPEQRTYLREKYGVNLAAHSPMIARIEENTGRRYRQSLRRASQILQDANYPRNERGEFLDPQTGLPLVLRALTTSANEKLFNFFRPAFETVGLGLEVQVIDDGSRRAKLFEQGNFDLGLATYGSSWLFDPTVLRRIFEKKSETRHNYGFSDEEVEEMLLKLEGAQSRGDQILLIQALDEFVTSKGYLIPILYSSGSFALHHTELVPRYQYTDGPYSQAGDSPYYLTMTWAKRRVRSE